MGVNRDICEVHFHSLDFPHTRGGEPYAIGCAGTQVIVFPTPVKVNRKLGVSLTIMEEDRVPAGDLEKLICVYTQSRRRTTRLGRLCSARPFFPHRRVRRVIGLDILLPLQCRDKAVDCSAVR